MWENTVEPGSPQMTIWHVRIACWITKTTNAHSQYVILIVFPLQQWLYERTSVLHYSYTVSLVEHVPEICMFHCCSFFLVKSKTSGLGIVFFKCWIIRNSRLSDTGLKEFVCTKAANIDRILHVPAVWYS